MRVSSSKCLQYRKYSILSKHNLSKRSKKRFSRSRLLFLFVLSVDSPDERVQSGHVEISSREHEESLKTKANNCIFACRKHLRASMQDFVTFPMVLVDRRSAFLNLLLFWMQSHDDHEARAPFRGTDPGFGRPPWNMARSQYVCSSGRISVWDGVDL